jgi:hypothetical protein
VIEVSIRDRLKDIEGLVSFTFDTWTSASLDPYLSITGHYVHVPAGRPYEWELKSEQLAFSHIDRNHSGDNLSNILVRTVDRYNLRKKVCPPIFFDVHALTKIQVGWFTADNASNNDVAIRTFGTAISQDNPWFDATSARVR